MTFLHCLSYTGTLMHPCFNVRSIHRSSSKLQIQKNQQHVFVPHRIKEKKKGFCRYYFQREGKYPTPYDRTLFYTYIMFKCLKQQTHLFCPQAMSKQIFQAYTWGLGDLFSQVYKEKNEDGYIKGLCFTMHIVGQIDVHC